tara:strand:+ start:3375 stop:4187 length:813 start_codon:yes stop_codon:yes gene_type:complete
MENVMKRTGFIGGSDCVKIMQGDWYDLWQIKTGKITSPDLNDNLAVRMGSYTESFNMQWFEENMPKRDMNDYLVHNQQYEYERNVDGVPMKGTIDGMCRGSIVECKHTNSYNTMDGLIEYYMPQLQCYMRLAGKDGCFLSAFFGNNKWECSHVAWSESYFNLMMTAIKQFWSHVDTNTEPLGYDQPATMKIDSIPVDDMIKRDANGDNHFTSIAHDYIGNEAYAKSFESAKKSLKQMVGDNEREVYCDLLTIRRDKRGSLRISTRKENAV